MLSLNKNSQSLINKYKKSKEKIMFNIKSCDGVDKKKKESSVTKINEKV